MMTERMHMKMNKTFESTFTYASVLPILVRAIFVFITLLISLPVYITIAVALLLAKKQLPHKVFSRLSPYLHPYCCAFASTLKNPSNLYISKCGY